MLGTGYKNPTKCMKKNLLQKSLTLSVRPFKKILSPRMGEVWGSSNFVKVIEVEFPSKSLTLSVRPSKKNLSPRFCNHLEAEFPSKKSDTFGETIQKKFKSQIL